MSRFFQFLKQIDVADDDIDRMKSDKINEDVILIISDEELAKYIPHRGHRILAIHYCKTQESNSTVSTHSTTRSTPSCSSQSAPTQESYKPKGITYLIDSVRAKLVASRKRAKVEKTGSHSSKADRVVELGWCHFNEQSQRYIQVRKPSGGGTRHPQFAKNASKADIIQEGLDVLSPFISDDMIIDVSFDVRGTKKMPATASVGELYEKSKMKTLRLYILTKDMCLIPYSDNSGDELSDTLPDMTTSNAGTPSSSVISSLRSGSGNGDTQFTLPTTNNYTMLPISMQYNSVYQYPTGIETTASESSGNFNLTNSSASGGCIPSTTPGYTSMISEPTTSGTQFVAVTNQDGFSVELTPPPPFQLNSVRYNMTSTEDWQSIVAGHTADATPGETQSLSGFGVPQFVDLTSIDIQPPSDEQWQAMGTPTVVCRSQTPVIADLHDALLNLEKDAEKRQTHLGNSTSNRVNVARDDVLDGGLRAFRRSNFNAENKLFVRFSGEQGIDNGGPTREFLELCFDAIRQRYFYGNGEQLHIRLVANDLSDGLYAIVGKIIAYSMVHRGPMPTFFCSTLYDVIVQGTDNLSSIVVNDGLITKDMNEKLSAVLCSTREEFFEKLNDVIDIVELAGCSGLMTYGRREELVQHVKRFTVLGRLKEAFDQLISGLATLGVLDLIRTHPDIMRGAFLHQDLQLTADKLEDLFPVEYSPEGSNRRKDEDKAGSFWRDYLMYAETTPGGLANILKFATGSKNIPVLGFRPQPALSFRHLADLENDDFTKEFPIANTCGNILKLPILGNYQIFQDLMEAAMGVMTFTTE